MYDLTIAAALLVLGHIAVTYAAIEIWKLEYNTYIAVTVAVGIVISILLRASSVVWKDRLKQIVDGEARDRELLPDALIMVAVMIGGGIVTSAMVYRRFGVAGWAGAYAANMVASYLV